jgi:segregation and condensation protein B
VTGAAKDEDDDEERLSLLRLAEALLFAAPEPMTPAALAERLGPRADAPRLLAELAQHYAGRGIRLVETGGAWSFRTAPDLAAALSMPVEVQRRLSRAALETLAIVAYHQPVTRAEIEGIRGVATSRGTLDLLMEIGWIRPGRRREVPGRPVTWLTTDGFLHHFGLPTLRDLPGVEELKAIGLLDPRPVLASIPGGEEEPADDGSGDDDDGRDGAGPPDRG